MDNLKWLRRMRSEYDDGALNVGSKVWVVAKSAERTADPPPNLTVCLSPPPCVGSRKNHSRGI